MTSRLMLSTSFIALLLVLAVVSFAQADPDHPEDHGRPVSAIAAELGVTPDAFRAAFRQVTPARKGERPTEEQRRHNRAVLSAALGVTPERLDAVMDKYRPEGPRH